MGEDSKLPRRAAIARILAERQDTLVVTGLGSSTYDCAAVGDHSFNFYLWGAMGSAVTVGLGLALAQPNRRVLVITGDGEMLMSVGALATIALQNPPNLTIAVLDNERFGETGMQKTHTANGVDLAGMATAAGFKTSRIVRTMSEVTEIRDLAHHGNGPVFAQVKI